MHTQTSTEAARVLSYAGAIPTSYFKFLIRGKVKRFDTPWDNQYEKELYIGAIRMALKRRRGIKAYSFVTEAWLASVDPKTQPELMNVAPRHRSNREDALMILSRHRDGEEYCTKYHIDYDTDGRTIVGKAEHLDGSWSEGFMGNLFKEYLNA